MTWDALARRGARGGVRAGIALYLVAVLLFAAMDVCTKLLVAHLPVLQVTWARFTVHTWVMGAALPLAGQRLRLWPRAPRLQVLRSFALAGSNLFTAAAVAHAPLATVTAINFTAPLLTVGLAAAWLREAVGRRRWAAVAVGLGGVVIVLRPGVSGLPPAAFLALGSAAVYAVYQLLTRRLAGVDTSPTTILQTGLWPAIVTSVLVPLVWTPPVRSEWLLLGLVGVLGGVSHFLLVLAFERAPASLLAPLSYSQMIWASLSGLALFGERLDGYTATGAVVIAAAGLLAFASGKPPPTAGEQRG